MRPIVALSNPDLAGADTGELLHCARARRSWKSTALAWSDPEIARDLAGPFDGSGGQSVDGPE
ncbi:hypothetical protein GCM10009733_008740 [Nonomuraea maheshkhaliensis]|uniref:Uncharacterized protein n=1 Tax=Nonomuraea maheshkhaliensis TaxID=419590 RepID=A0ABP4QLD4_9ACTN